MTTDTPSSDTNVRYLLTIWLPNRARLDSIHTNEADARAHLAAEADRLGLAAELVELLHDEATHRDLILGGPCPSA
jgi:hypothetical protein